MTILPVVIPYRIRNRPKDSRGLPIPFSQFVSDTGVPDFRVLDELKVKKCLEFRRCGLCGEPMGNHIFFIGGDLCRRNFLFHDPPMHRECAEFALRTCPHLNRIKGKYSTAPFPTEPGYKFKAGAGMSDQKAAAFFLMHTMGYRATRGSDGMLYIKADAPWISVQEWRDGGPLPEGSQP